MHFSDPYYTEYTCKAHCVGFWPDRCNNCCQKFYSPIVMVVACAIVVFGVADLFVGGKAASLCPENGALFSSLMLAQGVISMIEGIMIFYSIGRAHEYVFFKSGLPTFQYAFVTYSLTAMFYIASLTLSGFQMTGTEESNGFNHTNCSDYYGYIFWRFAFNVMVPISPIVLVLSILAWGLICSLLSSCLCDNE